MKKILVYMLAMVVCLPFLYAKSQNDPGSQILREKVIINQTDGEVWNYMTNYGCLGGEGNSGLYGLSWPGGATVNNFYLWLSYFVTGCKEGGTPYVTYHNYPDGEWWEGPVLYEGPGYSPHDIVAVWPDSSTNTKNAAGRHTGITWIVRAMQWPHEPYNDFIIYWMKMVWNKDQCDIPDVGETLDSVYVSMWYDCDVSGADQSNPHIDDLVGFDGWTNGEWNDPDFIIRDPIDIKTVTPDSFWDEPDGINDHYLVWGDEEDEMVTQEGDAVEMYIPWKGESLPVYLIPRGISYIYDGDNPGTPGNDTGEEGACAGYAFGGWLYTPPAPSDSIGTGTFRLIRPWSHQWWNWESDPASDDQVYNYQKGNHSATQGYRYAPHPYDLGAAEFDYRFLNTVGPYTLYDGDTLHFVWVAGVGQGLYGGNDDYWGRGWLMGAAQTFEKALQVYYGGAENSDPAHPSAPNEDVHFYVPVPPPSPHLNYTATPNGVQLVWDDVAERSPDPLKGVVDTRGYRVYRAYHEPRGWQLIQELPFEVGIFRNYVDTTALIGFPVYYTVTAYDEDSLESANNNYKKDANGNPLAIEMKGEPSASVDDVFVAPNPYKGSAKWLRASEIGDKIMFLNVPRESRITIYTLSGDRVISLQNTTGEGAVAWNLLNEEGLKVVSGIYIYKVEDKDGNYKIGKFMILR
jgi:hypothetical protein